MLKNKRGLIYIFIGVTLLLLSALLIAYNVYEDINAAKQSSIYLEKIKNTKADDDVITVDNNTFCGILKIEALGIELPVFNCLNSKNLKISPCRYLGSVNSDNIIIAAHNYKSHFGNINQLKNNDVILFIDSNSVAHKYSVKEIIKLDGTAVTDMQSGEWDFTLFTCTKGGKQRVTVRCERLK